MSVGACEHISDQVGVHIFVVGFVVAAIASSFPDTLLSIKDAQKGKYMDAFSNAFGSNIFDIWRKWTEPTYFLLCWRHSLPL